MSNYRPPSFKDQMRISKKWRKVGPGVYEIPDVHHQRGYRIYRTPDAMRILTNEKAAEQDLLCGICNSPFTNLDIVPDHISPRGMGAAWRDDHEENIRAVHSICNGEKGSKRI